MLWKNDHGFFLADMLLSLAAFLLASAVLLPLAIVVMGKTADVRTEGDAGSILFDELMYLKVAGASSGRDRITQNGNQYEVTVTKDENESAWEVCVHYESDQHHEKKCSSTE